MRSVADWLRWQEALHPRPIELGLERVRDVFQRLLVVPPPGRVFTVGGTNGKGSTVTLLAAALQASGLQTGLYTSPHLGRYQERIGIDGVPVDDDTLVAAFAAVEQVRQGIPLTYFEFGTLAALVCFARSGCGAWVLEVGLGGRLDAVNVVDADYAIITTIGLDHQEWLGHTLEAIAEEKAGILRPNRPAFYGDNPVPRSIAKRAEALAAPLLVWQRDYCAVRVGAQTWSWQGREQQIDGLLAPEGWAEAQFRNASLVLAVLDQAVPAMTRMVPLMNRLFEAAVLPGRFERVQRLHQWILDVAHNPQAAATLVAQLQALDGGAAPRIPTTVVLALLADKVIAPFVATLRPFADQWVVTGVDDPRASSEDRLRGELATAGIRECRWAATPVQAFALAAELTPVGGRIIVCGSFRVVAPAREWLGLY